MWRFLHIILGFIRLYLDGVKVLIYQLFNESFRLPDLPKQNGKVAIVTGGARGMGYEISRHLVSLGMHVFIGNEEEEGLSAVKKIQEEFSQGKAGIMLVSERRTEDGFELHFGLNYLGHFLLTNLLLDLLKKSGKPGKCSRIVIMSSSTHYGGRLSLEDLQGRKCYSAHGAYAQSKLALLLFSYHLQDKLWSKADPVTVNTVDPGMVDTALYDNLCGPAQLAKRPFAKLLFRTPAEGASTAIYAAAASELEGIGRLYLYNGRKTESSAISYDEQLQARLWKESCALVGLHKT
ncbi:dehydrogenase/reductase SDR family member on chromosome X isoform X4 [Triplophysa dalaica]|uniref:dehydrogenase/reductase SDR family member on chromosome X isoform X4 n=1 Tax=Triplophysa dalaica TaxID=1582913 RepID=UPI0024DFCFEB|nr:dehydrogenase/reductase SDR family member on chromosome X isoform X4 [Triplophysa dalaica]